MFWNVNFPPCSADAVKGVRLTRQGKRHGTSFSTEPHLSPSGRRFLWIRGGDQRAAATPDSDADANLGGYVSVTPMRADFTAHDAFDGLKDAFA